MKNTITSILSSSVVASALAIGSLASTQYASAQSETMMAEVTIPFSFQTTTQTLPAGTYRIVSESNHLIRLEGSGSVGGFVYTYDAIKNQAPNHGSVVFDHTGDKYYLRQIWTAGSRDGMECPKSKAEKQSLQASITHAPTTVEVALNTVPKH
jgi:hypothetical protein